jgi:hypothetical protein
MCYPYSIACLLAAGGNCSFSSFHNPVQMPCHLYVDLISTPHELLGPSNEPNTAGVPVRVIAAYWRAVRG